MTNTSKISIGCFLLVSQLLSAGTCRAVELPLRERAAQSQVIARVLILETPATDPPGYFRHTARAKVILPIKGVVQDQIITLDFDTGLKCPNIIYSKGEDCLVFLTRQRNGRLITLNDYYGKNMVDGNTVRGWSVQRDSHRDVPLPLAMQMIRKLLAH